MPVVVAAVVGVGSYLNDKGAGTDTIPYRQSG